MGYMWFEEMELIADVEKEKGPATTDQSNAEPKNNTATLYLYSE